MFESVQQTLSQHLPWLSSPGKQGDFEWAARHDGKLVGPRMDYKRFVVGTGWALWATESYVLSRQLRMFSLPTPPAALADQIPQDTYDKARSYNIERGRFGLIRKLLDQISAQALITSGLYVTMWDTAAGWVERYTGFGTSSQYPISTSLAYASLTSALGMLFSLPFDYYSTFVIEQRHGFNKSSVGLWLMDKVKGVLVATVVGLPLTAAFLWIVDWAGEGFVKYLMVFFFVFIILFQLIYPTFIQPLFNKLTPLPEGELRQRVEALAGQLKFPLKHLYVIDGSKRSSHSNAYFYGLPWDKHIVIYDTLIEQSTPGEIEAVLAHELGHWKYAHPTKLLFVGQFHIFVTFSLFALFLHNPSLYSSFGFSDDIAYRQQPVYLGFTLFGMISSILDPLISFSINVVTRHYEYQADKFAVNLGKGEDLKSALIKLQNKNLQSPHNDWLYSMWNHSHPTLVERLKAIDGYEVERKKVQ